MSINWDELKAGDVLGFYKKRSLIHYIINFVCRTSLEDISIAHVGRVYNVKREKGSLITFTLSEFSKKHGGSLVEFSYLTTGKFLFKNTQIFKGNLLHIKLNKPLTKKQEKAGFSDAKKSLKGKYHTGIIIFLFFAKLLKFTYLFFAMPLILVLMFIAQKSDEILNFLEKKNSIFSKIAKSLFFVIGISSMSICLFLYRITISGAWEENVQNLEHLILRKLEHRICSTHAKQNLIATDSISDVSNKVTFVSPHDIYKLDCFDQNILEQEFRLSRKDFLRWAVKALDS